ncbi:MAG TPA: hypothetical protein VE288_04310 [Rubrobacteraceae bacterium]|nr:hypothetical protein [Rubrobacteraceae bacterium]
MRPAEELEGLLHSNLRRWLLIAAGAVTIFGIFHHVDHVVRGNHSGWPFQEAVTPFTFSLLIYALLVPGLYLTWRGHLVAGYWLFTKPAYVVILLVGGTVVAPLVAVPALPVETLAKITGAAGGDAGVEVETRKAGQLPQQFADRFGWEDMVATVAGVYRDLPSEERAESCIFTGNYGEAGAIDFFGTQYDLPKAISGHNSYYIWGPGDCSGQVIISVGVPLTRLEVVFDEVEQMDTSYCEYCMPDEDNLPIYVGRNPKVSLQEIWPQVRHYG